MTDQRQHLTTEDFVDRTAAEREPLDGQRAEREPVEQTPADHDVVEPDLTDGERFDREAAGHDSTAQDPTTHGSATYDTAPGSASYDSTSHDSGTFGEPTADDSATLEDEAADEGAEPVEPSAVDTTAGDAPLFTPDDSADYQAEWRALQADFVDDPREAVQRADELVAQVMQTLATTFTQHKHALEEQWQRGDEVQTEELRQALKRYRTFFDRLLSV
ncbi:hypothetical protein AB0425_39145 [Actinosynnema sp. NPDC051121]|nr:hypothetical protein [Saccharothrix sp.]